MKFMDRVEKKGKTGAGTINDYFKYTKEMVALNGAPVHLMINRFSHDNRSRLAYYARRLEKLSERARAFGADPIFITQLKGNYRIAGEKIIGSVGAYVNMAAYNRTLLDFCRARVFNASISASSWHSRIPILGIRSTPRRKARPASALICARSCSPEIICRDCDRLSNCSVE